MNKKLILTILLITALLLSFTGCSGSNEVAEETDAYSSWPEREIRIIVPYKEGGASHKAALLIKNVIEKNNLLEKPIIVVCMPNAATLEGQEEVLNSEPDGYTLLLHHNAMINGYALGKQPYTFTDFDMINQIYETPLAIGVAADSPYNTLGELTDAIKSKEEKTTWTWVGTGGNTHFASYVYYDAAGINVEEMINPVITKSDGDSITTLLGGQVEVVIAQLGMYTEFVKSGDVKVLGHSGEGDIEIAGVSIPSWEDCGYEGKYNLRAMLFAPKGVPQEIMDKLDTAMRAVVENQDFIDSMSADGFLPVYLNSQDAMDAFAYEAENANKIGEKIK